MATERPNIIVVVFDDTGWADFGCFGSEISTPTIDRLASEGAQYTNFHVTPLCSPTRAALLTGRNPHRVGMGWLADLDLGTPARRGRVHQAAAMLPKYLAPAGYLSYLVGKWHLTPQSEVSAGGPYSEWPIARGFDRFYGFLEGCTDHFTPELVEDNHVLGFVGGDPDYHLTNDLIDRALRYVADHRSFNADRPFFLQLAFGATHAPFQPPPSFIHPYLDVFAKGWDQTRIDRLERQLQLGLLPEGTVLAERPADVTPWIEMGTDEQQLAVALQAAFAGFLTHTDQQLGRFLDGLARFGVLDDSVIVLLSDNGAAHDGGHLGSTDVLSLYNGISRPLADEVAYLDALLAGNGRSQYPEGWGMAGNTPFPRYKQFVDAGGVKAPMIVRLPPSATEPAVGLRHQFTHVVDIAPTLVELAGATFPDVVDGVTQLPIDGASFLKTVHDPSCLPARDSQYFELAGTRAIWQNGWKAISVHEAGGDHSNDFWRLFHVAVDPSETKDLALAEPDRLQSLVELFEMAARDNGVYPMDDRSLKELLSSADPIDASGITMWPEGSHLSSHTYLTGSSRHGAVTATIDTSDGWIDGTLISSGTPSSGYHLAVRNRALQFTYNFLDSSVEVEVPLEPPGGGPTSRVGLVVAGDDEDPARLLQLVVDREVVHSSLVRYTGRRLSFWGLDIGIPRSWPGEIPNPALLAVTIEIRDRANTPDMLMGIE